MFVEMASKGCLDTDLGLKSKTRTKVINPLGRPQVVFAMPLEPCVRSTVSCLTFDVCFSF